MPRVGRRHRNCQDFKVQGLREEESEEGRRRNECRTELQSSGADIGARRGETTLESLRGGGDRSQSHGTRREREREREGEEGIVWKKCMQRRCDSGWRSSVGGNSENLCNLEPPQAETDEACHD
jgi:hypothetical protein